MTVRLAEYSGYCFGVRRAIQMALEARNEGSEVFTLGELIHNPQIVQELHSKGIKVASEAKDVHSSTAIIRSHGIRKQELELLKANGNLIIDATCPYVKRNQEIIHNMVKEGYQVWILGDASHPEVQGMLSYGNAKTRVVAPGEELTGLTCNRLCLLAQTTQKLQNLFDLACELLPKLVELRVFNTICLATSQRQEAAVKLASVSDLMIIVGGLNSSNTRALTSLCQQICPTFHIETEVELDGIVFSADMRIGIAAGASTPEDMIVKVYNRILKKSGDAFVAASIEEIPLFKEES